MSTNQERWNVEVNNPRYPEMKNEEARRASFTYWVRTALVDTDLFVEAGFFYTETDDTVRCFYCGIGINNWTAKDDPWVEHARHNPYCPYLRQRERAKWQKWKPEFDKFIEHDRRFSSCEYLLRISNNTEEATAPPISPVSQASVSQSYARKWSQKEMRNPMLSAEAKRVRGMGYSKSVLKSVINEYIAKTGLRTFKAEDLLEIIFEREENGELISFDAVDDSLSVDGGSSDEEELELSREAYEKENQYLQARLTCIICKTKERSMVFLPCGHRITCHTCSHSVDTCLRCGSCINRKIKTFLY